jgi:hypothetical protein
LNRQALSLFTFVKLVVMVINHNLGGL